MHIVHRLRRFSKTRFARKVETTLNYIYSTNILTNTSILPLLATLRFFLYPYSTIKFVPMSKYISRIYGITYGVTLHKKQDDRIDRGGDKKSRERGRTMKRIKQERGRKGKRREVKTILSNVIF